MRRSRSRADETVGIPPVESLELKPAAAVRRPGDPGDDAGAAGRGQLASLFAAVGRIELTLDLLEKRLERVESSLAAGAAGPDRGAQSERANSASAAAALDLPAASAE